MNYLGHCVRRDVVVSEWDCKSCFWGDAKLRDDFREGAGSNRLACVDRHILAPRRRAKREAQVLRLRPMLDGMDAGGWEGIVRNALEVALKHPEEETSQILIRQIEAHAVKEGV